VGAIRMIGYGVSQSALGGSQSHICSPNIQANCSNEVYKPKVVKPTCLNPLTVKQFAYSSLTVTHMGSVVFPFQANSRLGFGRNLGRSCGPDRCNVTLPSFTCIFGPLCELRVSKLAQLAH
jgi:hypothetical protein